MIISWDAFQIFPFFDKEMESILIQQSGWQKLIENLTEKITVCNKQLYH